MSGKNNSRNLLQRKAQHASDITFADAFKRAGYATGITGKWKQSRGTIEIPGKDYLRQFGWDEYCCFDVVKQGRRYFNPSLVINGDIREYGAGIDPATGRRWYGPDICHRFALDFIKRHQAEPFFLYYPLTLVHAEDEGKYHVPTPDTVPRSTFDDFDDDVPEQSSQAAASQKYFPDMIRYTDKLIGEIVDELNALGLRKNTVIVIMSDNGTLREFVHVLPGGLRYRGGKGETTDNGMHVPLVLSLPGTIPSSSSGGGSTYDGLVDVTDIYPTLCAAAGIVTPNERDLDGFNFWPQLLGKTGHPRETIYRWYDETINEESDPFSARAVILEFAFDQHYKRYSPQPGFPRGRFFDLEQDPQEQGGGSSIRGPKFGIIYHSGLDLDRLNAEQQAAFERLGGVLAEHRYQPVTNLKISGRGEEVAVGHQAKLDVHILPANATRNNVIWESSNPHIASVDKFGVVTAHLQGTVKISVYSWDDAHPLANNTAETFSRKGVTDFITLHIR